MSSRHRQVMKVLTVQHRGVGCIFNILVVGLIVWFQYKGSVPSTYEGFVRLDPTPLTVSLLHKAVLVYRLTHSSSSDFNQLLPIPHGRLPRSLAARVRLVRRSSTARYVHSGATTSLVHDTDGT
jgi:hypothetical protein